MGRADKLAYFLDAEHLAGIFAEWPDDMNVVLCLDEEGGCEVLVYHKDEGRGVLRKVSSVLGRPVGQFLVVPEMRGNPTRKVLFSEEQKMLSLVAEAYDLPETATDYAINYQFAVEQGLDPETMRPAGDARPRVKEPIPGPRFRHRAEPVGAAAVQPPRGGLRPRIRLSMGGLVKKKEPAPGPALPPGYIQADARSEECHFVPAHLYAQDGHVRLVLSPEKVSIRTQPQTVTEVGFRDDFARFMLPRAALSGWRAGDAVVLDVPVERFPAALARRYQDHGRHAEVTVTSRGVFVAPGALIEGWVAPDARRKPLLRRVFTPARVAVLALLGAGAVAGTVMTGFDGGDRQIGVTLPFLNIMDDGPQAPVAPEVTRQLGGPLGLIDALAREEARGAP